MTVPRYAVVIEDRDEQLKRLDEAFAAGVIDEDEHLLLMSEPWELDVEDIERVVRLMVRVGIMRKVG